MPKLDDRVACYHESGHFRNYATVKGLDPTGRKVWLRTDSGVTIWVLADRVQIVKGA